MKKDELKQGTNEKRHYNQLLMVLKTKQNRKLHLDDTLAHSRPTSKQHMTTSHSLLP